MVPMPTQACAVVIPTDTPTEETMHSLESGVESLIEGGMYNHEDGESMTPVDGGSCFRMACLHW